jgi:hypothetical protein
MVRQFFAFILAISVLASCREPAVKLPSDDEVQITDLVQFATEQPLPVVWNDSTLAKKVNDSLLINPIPLRQSIGDSVFTKLFGTSSQLKLYLLGKSTVEEEGTYLYIKSVAGAKKAISFLFFTSQPADAYQASMLLHETKEKSGLSRFCRIDSKHNIAFVKEQKTPTGEYWTSETIYYKDKAGSLILAVTNSDKDLSDEILGNPIDTFPRTQKLAGDYRQDKKNLVSIRDGRTSKSFMFFIHFSKQNGECIGELKGEGEWVSNDGGIFQDKNSSCMLEFHFSKSGVRLQEINGCGSYRGITCFFEGTFARVKEPAAKKPAAKKK